jgi:hypothetical protein
MDKPLRGFFRLDPDKPGWGWLCLRHGSAGPYLSSTYMPVKEERNGGGDAVAPIPQDVLELELMVRA